MPSIYKYTVKDIQGNDFHLSALKGKVVIIVNTASQCGFTPQYKVLEEIYQRYKEQGLVILGFPCNQFGKQEPGTNEEIKTFCETQFSVTFSILSKVDVNGDNQSPLFSSLKSSLPGLLGIKSIKWNFTKFIIDKNGIPIKRFSPKDGPLKMVPIIESLLS